MNSFEKLAETIFLEWRQFAYKQSRTALADSFIGVSFVHPARGLVLRRKLINTASAFNSVRKNLCGVNLLNGAGSWGDHGVRWWETIFSYRHDAARSLSCFWSRSAISHGQMQHVANFCI